jgi:hypothetical protein
MPDRNRNRKYVDFGDICISIYVRQQLSEERVALFQELYTSSSAGTVPPILVSPNFHLIDGRHRLAALKGLGEKGAVCEIVGATDPFDMTICALKANVGGSKELSMSDIRQTIIRLLEAGNSQRKITAALPFPKELSRKLVKTATAIRHRQAETMATIQVMAGQMSPEEASSKFHLPVALINKLVEKRRNGEEELLTNPGSLKGAFTQRYYAFTKRMGITFKKLLKRFEDGEFTEAQVQEVIVHVLHQARNHESAMKDWENRFKVMLHTHAPMSGKIPTKKLDIGPPMSA